MWDAYFFIPLNAQMLEELTFFLLECVELIPTELRMAL